MTTYLSAKRQRQTTWIRRIFAVVCIVLFVAFWPFIRTTSLKIFDPIALSYEYVAGGMSSFFGSFHTYFTSKQELSMYSLQLERENEELRNELGLRTLQDYKIPSSSVLYGTLIDQASLNVATSDASSTLATSSIFALSSISDSIDNSTIQAYPLLPTIASLYQTLRISKGFGDGVEVGMLAYGPKREVLGYVKEVSGHSALVDLFSAPSTEVSGVFARTGVAVILIGDGGGSYIVDLPRDIDVVRGDTVLFGEEESYVLGVVADVTSVQQDVGKRVYVRGAYNPSSIRTIYVAK